MLKPFVTLAGTLKQPSTAGEMMTSMGYSSMGATGNTAVYRSYDMRLYRPDDFVPPGVRLNPGAVTLSTYVAAGYSGPAESTRSSLALALSSSPPITQARRMRVTFDVFASKGSPISGLGIDLVTSMQQLKNQPRTSYSSTSVQ